MAMRVSGRLPRRPGPVRRPPSCAVVSLLCALSTGCAELADDDAPVVDTLTAPRPFCELSQGTTPAQRAGWQSRLWSAATVQREIANATAQSGLRCSPQVAYLAVYARMTAARDAARCTPGDPMNPDYSSQIRSDGTMAREFRCRHRRSRGCDTDLGATHADDRLYAFTSPRLPPFAGG